MTAMPSASASRKATDNKLQEGADTLQSEDAPDGSVEAINAVALRMVSG